MLLAELPYFSDAAYYYSVLREKPYAIWLDSQGQGRYDILVADPNQLLISNRDEIYYFVAGIKQSLPPEQTVFAQLKAMLPHQKIDIGSLPFSGGIVGFLAYDAGRLLGKITTTAKDTYQLPEVCFGLYDWAVVVDHQDQRAYLASQALVPETQTLWPDLVAMFTSLKPEAQQNDYQVGQWSSNLSFAEYSQSFGRIQSYIAAGDCYQVNLAQRFHADFSGDLLHYYRQLRARAQAPYGAYISTPNSTILSCSPEQFLAMDYPHITTKPIKGTRARGQTEQADDALRQSLMTSEKDHAENVMIVDLLRNDLSRVCQAHSVKVPSLFALESYTNVHHLVSTVTGTLREDLGPIDLLQACFPGGSITGAPKCRVMNIIDELEPHRRIIYCGSVLYIGYDWSMNSSICIRTILAEANQLYCWAGGGIVADSDVEAEYQETLDKVKHLRF